MTVEPRLKSMALWFRTVADLIDDGRITDAAGVVITMNGPPFDGILASSAMPPQQPDKMIAGLNMVAGWVGNKEKNDELRAHLAAHA